MPVEVNLQNLNKANLEEFKHVHECMFPVKYSVAFFKEILKSDEFLNKIATVEDKFVGVLSARILQTGETGKSLHS